MNQDESYIKFNCEWIPSEPVSGKIISGINSWRDTLYRIGLIGALEDGIGFGNISMRYGETAFLITGSATGSLEKLDETHYCLVENYDLGENRLLCRGPLRASSESLSHAVVYDCSPATNAVIHVHHAGLWNRYLNKLPTSAMDVPFGTPEMALEIKRLLEDPQTMREKFIVMGGHRDGIISFGESPDEAGKILLSRL